MVLLTVASRPYQRGLNMKARRTLETLRTLRLTKMDMRTRVLDVGATNS